MKEGDVAKIIMYLKSLISFAKTGSLRKAGTQMKIAHASIVNHIEKLENALDIKIIRGNTDKTTLTPNGEKLVKVVSPLINKLNLNFLKNILLQGESYKISIYSGDIRLFAVLFQSIHLKNFLQKKFQISINSLNLNKVIENIHSGAFDIAFFPLFESEARHLAEKENIQLVKISHMKLALCCNKNHPILKLKEITLNDIETYNILKPSNDIFTQKFFTNQDFNVIMDTDNLMVLEELISVDTNYISFFDYKYASHFKNEKVKVVNCTKLFPHIYRYAITLNDTKDFEELFEKVVKKLER
jgi:DNA-binding transcriptional LysR family regulator